MAMTSVLFVQSLGGRARSFVVWLAALLGLNLVLVTAYLASDVIRTINVPLLELSTSGLLIKVIQTLSAPLVGIVGAVTGFYFSSAKPRRQESLPITTVNSAWMAVVPAIRGVIVLCSHALVAVVFISLSYLIKFLISKISANSEIILAGVFPLHYILDVVDIVVVVALLVFGAIEAVRAVRAT